MAPYLSACRCLFARLYDSLHKRFARVRALLLWVSIVCVLGGYVCGRAVTSRAGNCIFISNNATNRTRPSKTTQRYRIHSAPTHTHAARKSDLKNNPAVPKYWLRFDIAGEFRICLLENEKETGYELCVWKNLRCGALILIALAL